MTEEELFQMISEVDEDFSGAIDFGEFLAVIERQKEKAEAFAADADMVDAFVACGGNEDRTGHVTRDRLVQIITKDFGLTIDIEALIDAVDTDHSGEIEFEEFKSVRGVGRNCGGRGEGGVSDEFGIAFCARRCFREAASEREWRTQFHTHACKGVGSFLTLLQPQHPPLPKLLRLPLPVGRGKRSRAGRARSWRGVFSRLGLL